MPSSWKDFIACEDMTNNDIKVQSAIWELVTTEADYILVLQAIVEVSYIYTCINLNIYIVRSQT